MVSASCGERGVADIPGVVLRDRTDGIVCRDPGGHSDRDCLSRCAWPGHAHSGGRWTGIGARNGILIKNATALEQTSNIQAIMFDKTGTLTEGKPAVTDLVLAEVP